MLNKILSHPDLIARPPVLVDVGASGTYHRKWRGLAHRSICVEFDADDRDFSAAVDQTGPFLKRYRINRIVSDRSGQRDFFLTHSPHCSSTLPPLAPQLEDWVFADLFAVCGVKQMEAVTISNGLSHLGLDYVDWLKLDTQGTDLKILRSLRDDHQAGLLVTELEPGFIDAYRDEDKLFEIVAHFDQQPFWLSNCDVRGVARIRAQNLSAGITSPWERKLVAAGLERSACWAELTYVNRLTDGTFTRRNALLTCAFLITLESYGAAMDYASRAQQDFSEPLFAEIASYCRRQLMLRGIARIPKMVASRLSQLLARH